MKTLRDYGCEHHMTEGAYLLIDDDNPILNARIIPGPCQTCGGTRLVPDTETLELDEDGNPEPSSMDMVPCPDCPPPSIVPEEVWEAVRLLLRDEMSVEFAADDGYVDRATAATFSTLGPVRRAKAVLTGRHKLTTTSERGLFFSFGPDGSELALLHPEGK